MSIVSNRPRYNEGIITDWEIVTEGPNGEYRVGVRARRADEVARSGEDFSRQWVDKLKQVVQHLVTPSPGRIQEGSISISSLAGTTFYRNGVVRLGDITVDWIEELIYKFNQSNQHEDLENFYLQYQPSLFRIGGRAVTAPPQWKNLKQWRELWSVPDDISCAALSLCYAMYYNTRAYSRDWKGKNKRNSPRSWKDAKDLMYECGWDKEVNIWELKKFIKKYPQYKITLFDSMNLKVANPYQELNKDLTGETWVMVHDADGREKQGKNIVLFLDSQRQHYFTYPHSSIGAVSKAWNPMFGEFCWDCKTFDKTNLLHECGEEDTSDSDIDGEDYQRVRKRKPRFCQSCDHTHDEFGCPQKPCPKCSLIHYKEKCKLFHQCRACEHVARTGKDEFKHRDILGGVPLKKQEFLQEGEEADGSKPALVAWDIEAYLEKDERHTVRTVTFPRDINGRFQLESVQRIIHETVIRTDAAHFKINMICAEDVFTGKLFICESYDENDVDPMDQFFKTMRTYNMGNVILYAHNSSGFDSKLVLEASLNNFKRDEIVPIRRNQKILQLTLGVRKSKKGKLIFRDSMCHLPGSLAKLAKDICDGVMAKGYFPHRFNHPRNYGKGEIDLPSIEDYEPWVTAKSQADLDKFYTWHKVESVAKRGRWNLERELKFYCMNDVKVLATILKKVHDINMDDHDRSNWFHATGPGFVHKLSLHKNFELLDDEHGLTALSDLQKVKGDSEEERVSNMTAYSDKLTEIAKDSYWAVQMQKEKAICLPALRGGRTEIRQLFATLTDEEKSNGCC